MNIQSLGDLSQTLQSRRQHAQLKLNMTRLSEELASGQAADVTRHLAGNFGHLSDIEHDLLVLESYRVTSTEAALATTAMQEAFKTVQDLTRELGAAASLAITTQGPLTIRSISEQGRGTLDSIVSSMNTSMAGRFLFSGTDVDARPLASTDALLTSVQAALVGATTASDVVNALDTFFDTPGGTFETTIYQGGTTFLSPYQLGEGESVRLDIRTDNSAVRNALKYSVMAALADDASLTLNGAERAELARQSGERLMSSQSELIGIRSDLGYAQSRIEQSATRISTEMAGLSFARNELVAVDKFKTATELENVQVQLETLYTLTARASRLSLVNFLS